MKKISNYKRLAGKIVLVRVDFNVPVKNGEIQNDYKIRRSLETVTFLRKAGARVVLLSHLGRPTKTEKRFSLAPVAAHVAKLLKTEVPLIGWKQRGGFSGVRARIDALKARGVCVLENVRFLKGEENNDSRLAEELASLGDVFVLEGFAVAHRDSASVTGIQAHLPSFAGLLLVEELTVLHRIQKKPKQPFVVILGGAKAETKIPVLERMAKHAGAVLVGGGIVNTYLAAQGYSLGASIVARGFKKQIITLCHKRNVIVPVDVVVGDSKGKKSRVVTLGAQKRICKPGEAVYDIGPETIKLYARYIRAAKTLLWNGAMGMFEVQPYGFGTKAIAQLFANRSQGAAFGVAGGGETVEVLEKMKLAEQVDVISTGGGAMLELLSGKQLPGIVRLMK